MVSFQPTSSRLQLCLCVDARIGLGLMADGDKEACRRWQLLGSCIVAVSTLTAILVMQIIPSKYQVANYRGIYRFHVQSFGRPFRYEVSHDTRSPTGGRVTRTDRAFVRWALAVNVAIGVTAALLAGIVGKRRWWIGALIGTAAIGGVQWGPVYGRCMVEEATRAYTRRSVALLEHWAADAQWLQQKKDRAANLLETERLAVIENFMLDREGDWMAFTQHCSKINWSIPDLLIGVGPDGRWYVSRYHYCVDMLCAYWEFPTGVQHFRETATRDLAGWAYYVFSQPPTPDQVRAILKTPIRSRWEPNDSSVLTEAPRGQSNDSEN